MSTSPFLKIDAVGIGTAALIAAAAYFCVLEPARSNLAAQQALRTELESVLAETDSLEGSVRERHRTIKELALRLHETRVELLPPSKLNQRVQGVTTLAGERGITVEQVSPGKLESDANASVVSIKLIGNTTYPEAREFLAALRQSFPDISVSGLRVQRAPGPVGKADPRAAIEFSLAWHALPSDSAGQARTTSAAGMEQP